MALTPQQHDAVYRREVSVVLSSGAGCGKTHVLTRRYLSHLERDGAEVGQIVAITFTERAARQMRERIRKAVTAHLADAEGPDEVERWEQHLRALESAQISTIHAFCATLLRQNAVEAGLDPRFDVLEDFLAVNLETEALSSCLQRLLTEPTTVGEDLRQLILLFGWRPVVEAVRGLLRDREPSRQRPWAERPPAEVAAEWLRYAREELLPRHVRYLTTASPKIARCLWLLRNVPCTGPKMAANVDRVLEGVTRLTRPGELPAALAAIREAAKVQGTERDKAWPSPEAYEEIKDALEALRSKELPNALALFVELLSDPAPDVEENGNGPHPSPADAVVVGQRFLRVAEEAAREYQRLKRRHGVVDFQDLLVRARDLLRDHAAVRERLQKRFRFLLIDELQDTDPVQMELVEYLAGAGLSEGKLFAVGDHAQSIYRFRGADVHLFQELRRRVPFDGRLGLTRNFRSQPAILDFVNALFGDGRPAPAADEAGEPDAAAVARGQLKRPAPVPENAGEAVAGAVRPADAGRAWGGASPSQPATPPRPTPTLEDYEPLRAHHAQLNPGPCVEFLWSPRDAGAPVAAARQVEAEWIARRIAGMVLAGERLVAGRTEAGETLRPVRPGDVVLLFRAMTSVEVYEAALRRHGLDYYLVGGRAFYAQQEIYDLLNLLRTLENPQDEVSLAGTLRSPFGCLSDEALFVLSRHRGGLWAGLHDDAVHGRLPEPQKPRAERVRACLDRWRGLKNRLPIARLLGVVLADSGYDAALQFEFLGDRKLANLWKLIDLARSFDRSGLFGLAEFIDRLGELVRSQPREEQAATQPENADVVRLMSIHQAKGLEFPVVFVPDLAADRRGALEPVAKWDRRLGCVVKPPPDEPPPFPDAGWRLHQAGEDVANWQEDLRTFYVACTRAMDYLVLSAALPDDFAPQTPWLLALAGRFDLPAGRCLLPGLPDDRVPRVRVTNFLCAPPDVALQPPAVDEVVGVPPEPAAANADMNEVIYPVQWDAEDGSDRGAWPGPPR